MNAQTAQSFRRIVIVLVALAALSFGAAASARDHVSISFGGPGYGISYSNWGGGRWGGYYSNYRPYYGGYGYYDGYRGPYRHGGYSYYSPYPAYRTVVHHRRPVVVRHVDRYYYDRDDRYYHRANDRYYDRDDRYYDRDRHYDRYDD